jgi:hypothetical protein
MATASTMKTAISESSHVPLKFRRAARGLIFIFEIGGAIVRRAVVTVKVAACVCDTVGTTVEGETAQLIVAGALQLSATDCLKPLEDITLMPKLAAFPAETAGVAVAEEIWKGGCRTPVPETKIT